MTEEPSPIGPDSLAPEPDAGGAPPAPDSSPDSSPVGSAPPRAPFPGFWQSVLLSLGVLALQVLFASITIPFIALPILARGGELNTSTISTPALLVVVNTLAFGLMVLLGWRLSRTPFRRVFPLGGVPVAVWPSLGLTLCGGMVLVDALGYGLLKLVPPPAWVTQMFADFLKGEDRAPAALALAVVAPVTEEFFFRGLVLHGARARYGVRRALVVSAGIFAGIHGLPWQVVPAFFLGLLFAWWTVQTGSLWPALVGHALNNGVAFLTGIDQGTGDFGMGTGPPLWLIALAAVGLPLGILWTRASLRRAAVGPVDLTQRSES